MGEAYRNAQGRLRIKAGGMNEISDRFVPGDPERPGRFGGSALARRPGAALTLPGEPLTQRAASQLDVNELWRVLMKWKWLILGVIIACVGLAVAVTLWTTPVFRASASLEINTRPVQVMARDTEVQPETRNEAQFLATQVGLLMSRSLAERVTKSLGLANNDDFVKGQPNRQAREMAATDRLMGRFEVTPLRGSNLIRIGYSDEDPARAARVVNAFAEGFIESTLERRYNATAFARSFLQSRLNATRGKLEDSERALVQYAQKEGIVTLAAGGGGGSGGKEGTQPSGDSLSAQSLVAFNDALAEATRDRITAEQNYRRALANRTQGAMGGNSNVQDLRGQKAQLEAEYQQKLATFKPDFPEMVALRQRIASMDTAIGAENQNAAATLRAQYEAARGREAQLFGQVNDYRSNVLNLRNRSIQYNILQREVDTNRTLYDALLQRFKEIG
ncbi:MAG: hypothetical protein DI610_05950, partial [Staphylococcus hominis]